MRLKLKLAAFAAVLFVPLFGYGQTAMLPRELDIVACESTAAAIPLHLNFYRYSRVLYYNFSSANLASQTAGVDMGIGILDSGFLNLGPDKGVWTSAPLAENAQKINFLRLSLPLQMPLQFFSASAQLIRGHFDSRTKQARWQVTKVPLTCLDHLIHL